MTIDRKLTIQTTQQNQSVFIEALEAAMANGWSRRRETERQAERWGTGPWYCFTCTAIPGRQPAIILLSSLQGGSLKSIDVRHADIYSPGGESLDIPLPQRNRILEEFLAISEPVADRLGIPISSTHP